MTDLTTLLRNLGWPLCHEAADEIDRLRAESNISDGLLVDAKAEVEQLKAELKAIEIYSSSHDDAKGMAFRALNPKNTASMNL